MARCPNIHIIFLLLFSVVPSAAFGQSQRSARLVEITSKRLPISTAPARRNQNAPQPADANSNLTEVAIRKVGAAYILNGQAVDPNLIASLVSALTAPANPELNLDDIGITPAWLKEHAASVAQRVSETLIGREHVSQAALESTFADPAVMDKVILELFNRRHYTCFDCTRYLLDVTVAVTFDDGSKLSAATTSESPFMLPWRVSKAAAYNADISRAVAALIPGKSVNRSLLLAENLDMRLGHVAVSQARNLDVEHRTGGTVAALRSKYTVLTASIGDYSDPVLRGPEVPKSENSSVLFQLRRSDTPDIFFDDELILPYTDDSAVGADTFLERAPQYEQLVSSVPWLNQFVRENKRVVRPSLAFSHGVSFSSAAEQAFSEDMHAIGRDKLSVKAEAAKDQIALLVIGYGAEESDWLVFPDHHMLLWRYYQISIYGKTDLLKWKPADFPRKSCAKIKNNLVGCVGIEISPNGDIIASE